MESKSTQFLSNYQSKKQVNQSIQIFGHGADGNSNVQNFVNFYDKKTSFIQHFCLNGGLMQKPNEYPLLIEQNASDPSSIAIANSDRSLQLLNIETGQLQTFAVKDFHKQKIESLRYKQLNEGLNGQQNGQKITTLLTASEDKLVKVWDCRVGQKVAHFQYGNQPFFSIDTNGQIVAAGSNEDLVFWDIRKIKVPLEVLDMSHSEDITSIRFHPDPVYHQRVLSCSTDCLVNFFDFSGKASMKEDDDVLEAVYRSEQPMIDCGFISNNNDKRGEKFYALTGINSVELCYLEQAEEAMFFTSISKFPHSVDYLIGVQIMNQASDQPRMLIHAGNNKGDVFIYEVDYSKEQDINEETGEIKSDNVQLIDMIITDQKGNTGKIEEHKQGEGMQSMQGVKNLNGQDASGKDDVNIVRNCLLMQDGALSITTNEANHIQIWRKNQGQDANMGDDDLADIGGFDDGNDCQMSNEIDLSQFS